MVATDLPHPPHMATLLYLCVGGFFGFEEGPEDSFSSNVTWIKIPGAKELLQQVLSSTLHATLSRGPFSGSFVSAPDTLSPPSWASVGVSAPAHPCLGLELWTLSRIPNCQISQEILDRVTRTQGHFRGMRACFTITGH